jgi:hypothetical protein
LKGILARQLDFDLGNQLVELSSSQFADFFQVFDSSTACRILRRIYSQPGNSGQYRQYQVKVRQENGRFLAIIEKTPNLSPIQNTSSTNSSASNPTFVETPFCDWLTIHQNYDFLLPSINGGCVVSLKSVPTNSEGHFDFEAGDVEYLTTKFISHGGSFDTNLQLRVSEGKMTLSGNVGRFSRPDNLYGFSLLDCVKKANRILDSLNLGLPHFTPGEYIPPQDQVIPCKKPRSMRDPLRPIGGKDLFIAQNAHVIGHEKRTSTRTGREYQVPIHGYIETKKHRWTGAWFSQVHFTRNLRFSDSSEAKLFVDWACRQNPFGMNVSPHYGQGVSYGKGSAYLNPKIYLKGLEILKNKKYKLLSESYKDNLLKFINNSIVRFEIEYKKYLEKNSLKYLGDFMDREKSNVLYIDFKNRLDKVLGSDVDFFENLENLTRRRKEQFYSWTRGDDFSAYSERTRRRLVEFFKQELNVNVSVPYHEGIVGVSVRKLSVQPLESPPNFYEISELDLGFRLVG